MYTVNAAADSVILHLWQYFHNIIFKIKYKSYIASGSALSLSPPQSKKILSAPVRKKTNFQKFRTCVPEID
jgi:hypothetical protein